MDENIEQAIAEENVKASDSVVETAQPVAQPAVLPEGAQPVEVVEQVQGISRAASISPVNVDHEQLVLKVQSLEVDIALINQKLHQIFPNIGR